MSLIVHFKTLRTYVLWALIYLVCTPIGLLIAFCSGKKRYDSRLYFRFTQLWNRLLLLASCTVVKIKGQENLPAYPDGPAIIVANHTSSLDIPLIDELVGSYPHIWMSKAAYGKVPLFGTLLRRMHVLVQREDPRHAARALLHVCKLAHEGPRHVVLFPEGTRSRNGKLQPFLAGFSVVARKLNRPVIPISIQGAYEVMPPQRWHVDPRACDIVVTVGEPMVAEKDETAAAFSARVHVWFSQNLD